MGIIAHDSVQFLRPYKNSAAEKLQLTIQAFTLQQHLGKKRNINMK